MWRQALPRKRVCEIHQAADGVSYKGRELPYLPVLVPVHLEWSGPSVPPLTAGRQRGEMEAAQE